MKGKDKFIWMEVNNVKWMQNLCLSLPMNAVIRDYLKQANIGKNESKTQQVQQYNMNDTE